MGVDVVDALLALHGQIVVIEVLPQVLGLLGGVSQEGLVALIRRIVLLNKVTDINVLLPVALSEAFPNLSLKLFRETAVASTAAISTPSGCWFGDASLHRR